MYWRLPPIHRLKWLFVTSLVFLVSWSWELACIMLVVGTVNHRLGLWLGSAKERRQLLLWIGISFNLLVLLGLKYSDFYIPGLSLLLQHIGLASSSESLRLLAPVGLSFVSIQMVSYLVDVHNRILVPEDGWLAPL